MADNKKRPKQPETEARDGAHAIIVTGTAQAWHLARLDMARDVIDELAAAISTTEPDNDTHRRVRRVIESLNDRTLQEWQAFVDVATSTEMDRDAMLKVGVPEKIDLNDIEQVVNLMWQGSLDVRQENWGVFEVHAEKDRTGQSFNLTTPFREVRISSLPEGTRLIRINDKRHAATAALAEILSMIRRDLRGFSQGFNSTQVWQRMAFQAAFYHKAVRAAAKTLPADEFLSWEASLPARHVAMHQKDKKTGLDAEILDGPRLIVELAGTARAQQILALFIVARFYTDLVNECEREMFEQREPAWVERTVIALTEAGEIMDRAIAGYNTALMAFYRLPSDQYHAMTILKPVPRDVPILAVIPQGTGATPVELRLAAEEE